MTTEKAPAPIESTSARTPTSASKSALNKSAYVRSLPVSMKARQVVEKGASEGVELSINQVHTIRANAKRKTNNDVAKRPVGRPKKTVSTATAGLAASAPGSAARRVFIDAALDLGLREAEWLLNDLRSKLIALYP